MPLRTMFEFSSWRAKVGKGEAHSVMVLIAEIVVVVVGVGAVVVDWVMPRQEQALE